MKTYEPLLGDHITKICKKVAEIAVNEPVTFTMNGITKICKKVAEIAVNEPVTFTMNGITVLANAGDSAETIFNTFRAERVAQWGLKEPSTSTVILGAADPEMAAIEEVAISYGFNVAYAGNYDPAYPKQGKFVRCHPGNANKCEVIQFANGQTLMPWGEGTIAASDVWFVECRVEGQPADLIIDHHNPGDPGFGFPPAKFWQGSSIGQFCKAISKYETLQWHGGEEVHGPADLHFIAAADHCLGAAYRGECPGVPAKAFAEWRVETRAKFQGRNAADIRRDIDSAKHILDDLKNCNCVHIDSVDTRNEGVVPELVDAAMEMGISYTAALPEMAPAFRGAPADIEPTGRTKYVLGGHTTPEQVRQWMAWAETLESRVGNVYGDPVRGFAGVLVSNPLGT